LAGKIPWVNVAELEKAAMLLRKPLDRIRRKKLENAGNIKTEGTTDQDQSAIG